MGKGVDPIFQFLNLEEFSHDSITILIYISLSFPLFNFFQGLPGPQGAIGPPGDKVR